MTIIDILPVILSGGGGTRLWPLSSAAMPKQFHVLDGHRSLLQETALRVLALTGRAPVIVANAEHIASIRDQLAAIEIEPACIVAEPQGRNTAPGIALAALWAHRHNLDSPMWVLPSDHRVGNLEALYVAARDAADAARSGYLATFGVQPTSPHTGYGYIRRGEPVSGFSRLYRVEGFREKPNAFDAAAYVESGDYLWNSGMFMFAAKRYVAELAHHAPEVAEIVERAFRCGRDHAGAFQPSPAFVKCPSISIDYAVMERTRDAVVVPLDADWSDIGTWGSLWDAGAKDDAGNVGTADSLFLDSSNCLVRSPRTVAVLGLDNIVIVEAEDGLLVCDRRHTEAVKSIGNALKDRNDARVAGAVRQGGNRAARPQRAAEPRVTHRTGMER